MGGEPLPTIAVPGQRLGDVNCFVSGPGTHVNEGSIFASIPGPLIVLRESQQTQQKQSQRATLIVSRSYVRQNRSEKGRISGYHSKRPSVPNVSENVRSYPANPRSTSTYDKTLNPTLTRQQYTRKLKFNTLPAVDSFILARVTRIQKHQATLSILVVDESQPGNLENKFQDPLDASEAEEEDQFDMNALIAATITSTNADSNNAEELRFQALLRREDVRAVEKDRVVLEDMFRVGDIVRAVVISMGDQSFYYCSTARNELGVVMARSEVGNMMFPASWREMRDPITGKGESRKVAKPF